MQYTLYLRLVILHWATRDYGQPTRLLIFVIMVRYGICIATVVGLRVQTNVVVIVMSVIAIIASTLFLNHGLAVPRVVLVAISSKLYLLMDM